MNLKVTFETLPPVSPGSRHETVIQFDARCTAGDVIRAAVSEELAVLRASRSSARRKPMPWLTRAEVEAQKPSGKIALPQAKPAPEISPQEAARAACDAFRKNRFSLWIDGVQMITLRQSVCLEPTSSIVFLRLIALDGG